MNKIISLLAILTLSTPAIAASASEYNTDSYEKYGYAAGASTIPSTNLNGGLRGARVAANNHKENFYYPGYTSTPVEENK